jgi:hypothetical protein
MRQFPSKKSKQNQSAPADSVMSAHRDRGSSSSPRPAFRRSYPVLPAIAQPLQIVLGIVRI